MFTAVDRRCWHWFPALVVSLGLWLGLIGLALADEPADRTTAPRWPSVILLEPPANRDSLLEKLRRPDLILWNGTDFDRSLLGRPMEPLTPIAARGVVESVSVEVRPAGSRAELLLRFGIQVTGEGHVVVPIALDGLILGRVSEDGADLAVATLGERRAWGIELTRPGEHQVIVETGVAIRSVGISQSLELAIPPAGSTTVGLRTERSLVTAQAGPDEPLALEDGPTNLRAGGHLSPRSRLELTWQERDLPGDPLPTVLAARGEVAITVGLDVLETRETWSVAALRGEAHELVVRLEADEEVVALEVDRRPVPSSRRHIDQSTLDELVVPLAEPIGLARSAMLIMTTRQPHEPGVSSPSRRFAYQGHPIQDARSQTGVIGVVRSKAIEITPKLGRAIRQIDPRTDLPDAFRGRPDGWLGFEFAAQPFDLDLAVAVVEPRFEVNTRSTISLNADHAAVATTLAGRVWQGRLFEIRVQIPPGLAFQPTEPTADGPTIHLVQTRDHPDALPDELNVTLANPVGPGESFTVPLRGTCSVPEDGPLSIPLFQPIRATVATSEVALVSGTNRRFDLAPETISQFVHRDATLDNPVGWTWPQGFDPLQGATVDWLRTDRVAAEVGVQIKTYPKVIRHRSNLTVAVDRQGAAVVDEVSAEVTHGSTATLDISLPPEIPDDWVAEAGETLASEPLDPDPMTGWRRFRLRLTEPVDSFQVRIRYRIGAGEGASVVGDSRVSHHLKVQPIRVLDGTATGQTIRLLAEVDVSLAARAPGWSTQRVGLRGQGDSVQQIRQAFEHPGAPPPEPIELDLTLGKLADLPTLVASRLWLSSTEISGGVIASTAQYRLEAHSRSVVVRLPTGSRWVRGMAGAMELAAGDVEQVAADLYRIILPAAVATGPVPLRIDSVQDELADDGSWPAPELVDGVVQQSVWELRLLGSRAGVGVPAGWTDENQWYRDGLIWKRQPRRTEADLIRWLTDGLPRLADARGSRPRSGPVPTDGFGLGGDSSSEFDVGNHSYLFSRPGPPSPLRFTTLSRLTVVLICSGPVLLVVMLLLGRRPPPRWLIGCLLALALGLAATVEINTALLVAESSVVGFALAAIAALIHSRLDRRNRPTDPDSAPLMVVASSPSDLTSTPLRPNEANEPTIIRPTSSSIAESTQAYPTPPVVRPAARSDPEQAG